MNSYQQKLNEKFLETYQNLNAQQRFAVDALEGPVMVIAGPGTGKTQILAARIGKILLDTDAQPQNILCLTYTEAGAIAMRRRLQQFIGADAYKVNIYTFHAFCNDVIQDNLQLFQKSSLEALSDLESFQLFETLIDRFPANHPLKRYRGDVYYEINNLKNLFSNMKREGWTEEFIIQKIEDYINDLPNREEFVYKRKFKNFNAGDVKEAKIEEEKEKMVKLQAAVQEFKNYQALMQEKSRYDFDDMINWVIKAFDENPILLEEYQERFQYILVDEYQDTSGTQNRLIQLLINYWDQPNIFVVGDDDQSIFRFQGANVENMVTFANAYAKDLKTVVLTQNYRSTQPILDVSKTIIDKNNERLVKQLDGLSKDLISANVKINTLTHAPRLLQYSTATDEMIGLTLQIEKLISEGTEPGKIAVIYKENKYGTELANYFRLKNIPFYSRKKIDLLTEPFTRKIIFILRYLNAEHDTPYGGDEMLFELLHFDFYKIAPIEIAKITVEANQLTYSRKPTSLRKILFDKGHVDAPTLFGNEVEEKFRAVSDALENLIADVPNVTLPQLFQNVMQQAGVLKFVMQSDDKIALLQMLTALFDFVKEEAARDPYLNLKNLVKILELMENQAIALPMTQMMGSEKGVNLLTTHGSKGLEFKEVFFAGVNAQYWERKRKPGGGYKLPDTMFEIAPGKGDDEELRRLFYVALTRAEVKLTLSFAQFKNDGKEMEPSMFLVEMAEQHNLPIENIIIPDEEAAAFQILNFQERTPQIEASEADFVDALLEKFVMNVTALNAYLDCPLGFYYRNLIRIPSGKSENLEFGSAVHYALEQLFKKMLTGVDANGTGKGNFMGKEDLINDFNWYLKKHRENFTKEAFDRRKEYGEEVLSNYYEKYHNEWNKVVAVERNIKGVVVNGVPLKGKLDKLEFDGKNVNVVDYKTGNIDYALPKMKGPGDKDPNGGDYWRQAVFYKILVDNYDQKDWKVISTEFDFVEPDKKKTYRKEKIVIAPADTETVKHQIVEVWNKIQAKDFYTGCGKPDCNWCNFVISNNLSIDKPLIAADEEEG